jgi:hypothetical protein
MWNATTAWSSFVYVTDCYSNRVNIPGSRKENYVDWRKIKTALEWARLGKFVLDLFAAIFSLKLVHKLLSYIPQISQDWATIIAWGVAATVLLLLIWMHGKQKASGQGPATQTPSNTLLDSAFDATAFFASAYTSTMHAEFEKNTRKAAEVNSPNDRESFYLKLIATGLPALSYDVIWANIFKSQVLALLEINRRLVPIAEVKEFYTKVAVEFPERYASYSFEQWMGFMKTHTLLIWHPSGMVEITVRGKDFLKYLTHCGRYADQRTF